MKKFIATTMLFALILMLPVTTFAESNSSKLNRDRLQIGRELIEVTSANWSSVLPYYTEDIEYHDPIVDIYGIDTMTQSCVNFRV